MPAPRAHRWEDEVERALGARESEGTKTVAVKLRAKKVDWILTERLINFYVSPILSSNKKIVRRVIVLSIIAKLRIADDSVIIHWKILS